MSIQIRQNKQKQGIEKEEMKFLQWAMKHETTSEFFITQTFVNGIQPNPNKFIRPYILTYLLNLANNIGKEVYAIGGSWDATQTPFIDRASHFHLMVSVPLNILPSVVMRMGDRDRNGKKLPLWGRHTCEIYDPDRGGFPYILSRHQWEMFSPIHPRK
jgi:hypothetical protein